jgi:mono/diheme cytochrome c family protein
VLVIIVVVAVFIGAIWTLTEQRFAATYDIAVTAVELPTDPADLEEGRRLSVTRGCVDCHDKDLGGRAVVDDPAIGVLYAANLTSGEGGIAPGFTDADWVRAIRHGVSPEGRPLVLMPSQEYYPLSDRDLGRLIAYLKSVPPVDRPEQDIAVGPVARVLMTVGEFPLLAAERIDHAAPRSEAPEPGETAAYGAYVAAGCSGCHREDFAGGPIAGGPPDWPPAANLTPHPTAGLGGWSEDDFIKAMREGVRPDGSDLNPAMPWPLFTEMTDVELKALWLFLRSVPPSEGRA